MSREDFFKATVKLTESDEDKTHEMDSVHALKQDFQHIA